MKVFFEAFSKILGFLFALLLFIVIVTFSLKLIDKKNDAVFSYLKGEENSDQKIAILNLSGPIISEPISLYNFEIFKSLEVILPSLIEKYLIELKKEKVVSLIVSINSPGGSVSATQKIFMLFEKFKEENKIPVFFHTTDILASGGYWVSLSGDKIFASYGALIGSIGVKGPDWLYYNSPTSLSTGILGGSVVSPNGIELFSNTAGISKDIFNPFRKPNERELYALQEMVEDIYDDFVNLVSKKRKMEKIIIKNDIGAMIFNTKKAKENFLINDQKNIDEIIDEISKNLNLDSKQIIINKKNNKYNLLSINILSNIFEEKKVNKYQNIIKSKFCNNLLNEFSAVSVSSYSLEC